MAKLKRKLILYASQEISAKSYNLITRQFLRLIMKLFLGGFSVSEFRQVRSPHGFSYYLHLTFLSSRNNQIADIAPAGIPCMGMRAGGRQNPLPPNALCHVQMHRRLPRLTRG